MPHSSAHLPAVVTGQGDYERGYGPVELGRPELVIVWVFAALVITAAVAAILLGV